MSPSASFSAERTPSEGSGGAVRPMRLESVDLLRGAVMILMALDHTRDFLGSSAVSPTDLTRASAALFLTRWITHFCAPVFFLLTGTGAYLSLRRRSRPELSRLLLTRGVWLIFLELTVLRCLAFQFNFDYRFTLVNVIWTLGWSMIALSALSRIPLWLNTAIGIAVICGHNLLDSIRSSHPLWVFLHSPGFLLRTPTHSVFAAYPLIPWIGVTAIGFSLGRIYSWPRERRMRFLLITGVCAIAAFVLLRALNIYGDPLRWTSQNTNLFTALSFLNTTKYPPSLLFLLMTLGPALLFLRAVDGHSPRVLRPALNFGRVPFFFFVLHIALIHALAVVVCFIRYGQAHWMFESPDASRYPVTPPPGWGLPLPVVYLFWAAVVLMLYPVCRWFARVKQRRRDPWLSYL